MNTCEINECLHKRTYGRFCKNHKDNYLLDEEGFIISERFSHKITDYKVLTLKKTCLSIIAHRARNIRSLRKQEVFDYYLILHKWFKLSSRDMKYIVALQGAYRKRQETKLLLLLHGPAAILREACNNTEDFYTFDEIKDIPQEYFFSYMDDNNIIWGFDIRSLNELLQNSTENPYTRVEIPPKTRKNIKIRTTAMINDGLKTTHDKTISNDKNVIIYQRVIDLFSRIEYVGLSCNENWLISLSLNNLKRVYRNMEDIWNYRLQLTREDKLRLSPPNGVNFNRLRAIQHSHSREDIIDILITDVSRFENSQDPNDTKLGYMYFIIGLGGLSRECYETHSDWLSFM